VVDWLSPLASSALVAGAVGASLAILGNFWVQSAAARRERRRYIARLSSEFLAHDAALIFNLTQQRRFGFPEGSDGEVSEVLVGIDGHMQKAWTAGSELTLVAPRAIAYLVQAVSGGSNALMVQSVVSDNETWKQSLLDQGNARLQLIQAVRAFVHAGKMSDDELGHDAIDPDDPTSTHNP
jgi:hypothetical protein